MCVYEVGPTTRAESVCPLVFLSVLKSREHEVRQFKDRERETKRGETKMEKGRKLVIEMAELKEGKTETRGNCMKHLLAENK